MNYMSKLKRRTLTFIAFIIACIHILPFYILMTTGLKAKGDYSSRWLFPTEIKFQNFTEAWEKANMANALMNTSIITIVSAILLIFVGSLAAYPLARRLTNMNKIVLMFFVGDRKSVV